MSGSFIQPIIQEIVKTLSLDEFGLFQSTRPEDCELIEQTNEEISGRPYIDPEYRLILLRDLIYNQFYQTPHPLTEVLRDDSSNYKNSISGGVESKFFQRLHRSNQGEGYADSGWVFVGVEEDGYLQVEKEGLMLSVHPEQHLVHSSVPKTIDATIAIKLPKNLLDPGLYIAVGNAGPVIPLPGSQEMMRLHFNFTTLDAPDILSYWTTVLNAEAIPFCFCVGHEQYSYDRVDPGILTLYQRHRSPVLQRLPNFTQMFSLRLQPEIPVFTKFLDKGIGYSEVPQHHQFPIPNFHLYHCHLIALGLLSAWEQDQDPESSILNYYQHHDLNPKAPYLNPHSSDFVYQLLPDGELQLGWGSEHSGV